MTTIAFVFSVIFALLGIVGLTLLWDGNGRGPINSTDVPDIQYLLMRGEVAEICGGLGAMVGAAAGWLMDIRLRGFKWY